MISQDDFAFISRLLKERSGLALTSDKAYLIATRMKPILKDHNLQDVSAMVKALKSGRNSKLAEDVVDAMTTNESLFFRDTKPFDALINMMLPLLCKARRAGQPIKIWCAAASTGQEPYSIAMLLDKHSAKFQGRDISILATDLSKAALTRAEAGEYTAFEVGRGMPSDILQKYFKKTDNNHYQISQQIRSKVTFRNKNLLEPFTAMGPFDIVFCRNVLIYFDRATKANVLDRLAAIMAPDGFLILGGPETTLGLSKCFERHGEWRNVYVRTGTPSVSGLPIDRISA